MTRPAPVIRPRTDEDLDALADVLVQVHARDGYPVEGVYDPRGWLVTDQLLGAWVATIDGAPLGHVMLTEPAAEDAAAHLWSQQTHTPLEQIAVGGRLFVSPQARGHRLGERLIEAATAGAQALGRRAVLDVMTKDAAAIATYERLGWTQIGSLMHAVPGQGSVPAYAFVSPPVA